MPGFIFFRFLSSNSSIVDFLCADEHALTRHARVSQKRILVLVRQHAEFLKLHPHSFMKITCEYITRTYTLILDYGSNEEQWS